ncbi:hypothetical protein [Cognatishimia sp. MH4019]|uniref:hypothetical protein n=1 Tax=Cognatishimia sp. MH4019 TaxID=2854030 RepID=UPI001CD61827|nr:hypothetical protein [Cognatishimia sp. MH4019]
MNTRVWFAGAAVLLLAACDGMPMGSGGSASGFMTNVPERVIEIAAPNQDLTRVKIDSVDGCYVYRYVGPVETTLLPLRTREGRPICSRPAETAAESEA